MRRQHIAVFPLIGKGHLYPLLELCAVLAARGFRVTCVVTADLADELSETGAQPIVYPYATASRSNSGRTISELLGFPHDPRWWEHYASSVYPALLDLATAAFTTAQRFYADEPPNLVLYDRLAFAGRIISKRLGIAAVQVYPHFAYYNGHLHREHGICINPRPMLNFGEKLDTYLSSHGIETKNNLWHIEELNIHFIPREFQHHASSFDDRFCFVGACINRPFEPSWNAGHSERPVILLSDFSSGHGSRDFFLPFIQAVSGMKCRLVVSTGESKIDGLDHLPENVELNRNASHLEILQHADLAICHGGTGSTLEALYHGVPVLVSPPTPPTAETSYRVVEMGVGLCIPRSSITSELIRSAIEELLSDAERYRRVQEIRHIFRQSGGACAAADRIQAFLSPTH